MIALLPGSCCASASGTAVSPQSGQGDTAVGACYALCRNVVLHKEPPMFQYNDGDDCPDHGPYGDDDCPKC